MPPWARASELHRVLPCPAAAVLPRGPDAGSPAARFGTDLHAWKTGAEPTPQVAAWLGHQKRPFDRGVWWPGGTHEVLLAVDRETVWTLAGTKEVNSAARLALVDTWTAGEADWVEWDPPWVDDLKTGWFPGRPGVAPQFRLYALAVARRTNEDAVLVSVTRAPRYPLGTPPSRETEVLMTEDLEDWFANVVEPARLRAKEDGGRPAPTPGEHCRFCRCHCPYNTKD